MRCLVALLSTPMRDAQVRKKTNEDYFSFSLLCSYIAEKEAIRCQKAFSFFLPAGKVSKKFRNFRDENNFSDMYLVLG